MKNKINWNIKEENKKGFLNLLFLILDAKRTIDIVYSFAIFAAGFSRSDEKYLYDYNNTFNFITLFDELQSTWKEFDEVIQAFMYNNSILSLAIICLINYFKKGYFTRKTIDIWYYIKSKTISVLFEETKIIIINLDKEYADQDAMNKYEEIFIEVSVKYLINETTIFNKPIDNNFIGNINYYEYYFPIEIIDLFFKERLAIPLNANTIAGDILFLQNIEDDENINQTNINIRTLAKRKIILNRCFLILAKKNYKPRIVNTKSILEEIKNVFITEINLDEYKENYFTKSNKRILTNFHCYKLKMINRVNKIIFNTINSNNINNNINENKKKKNILLTKKRKRTKNNKSKKNK